ncbi:MAG TPA: hypothetical protein VIW24_28710 [Aldersonia sp.]
MTGERTDGSSTAREHAGDRLFDHLAKGGPAGSFSAMLSRARESVAHTSDRCFGRERPIEQYDQIE